MKQAKVSQWMREHRWVILLATQLLILVGMTALDRLVYAINDDPTMVAISSGGYGEPSQYIINIHMLLAYPLKWLFTLVPQFNWITLLFALLILTGLGLMDWVFHQRVKDPVGFFVVAVVLDLMGLILFSYFTFTVVAYLCGFTGLVGATALLLKKVPGRKGAWAVAALLLLMGVLVRSEVYKSLLIGFFPVMVWFGLKEKKFRVILLGVICLAGMELAISSNTLWLNQNPVQKEAYKWGEARSAALDCAAVPYSEDLGMSKAQYEAIYANFYYVYDAIDTNTVDTLLQANVASNKYNFSPLPFLADHYGRLLSPGNFNNLYAYLFAATVLVYAVLGRREDRLLLFMLWGCALGCEYIFHVIQRAPYRVVMPGYLFAVLLILLLCRLRPLPSQLKYGRQLAAAGAVLVCCYALAANSRLDLRNNGWERQQVLAYMEQNNDKIFLAGNIQVFDVSMADNVWNCSWLSDGWNLMGGWEIYGVPYLQWMEQRGIEDPYNLAREAIDNPDILILTNWGDRYLEEVTWIPDLIEEYYGQKVEVVKVEDIGPDAYPGNTWSTYKIVSVEQQAGQ